MKKIIVFILLLYGVNVFVVQADYGSSYEKLNENSREIVEKANKYFDEVNTFKSNFIQFNESDYSMSEGMIYIEKPDKIRFEYTNPFQTLFIKNGGIINYYDIDMDEIIVIPQSISPIFDLFSKQDNIKKLDSEILFVENIENKVHIKTKIIVEDNEIGITYIFDEKVAILTGLNIKTSDNNMEISFFNAELNPTLNKKIFTFENPRLRGNRKNKRNG
jgi:outer membrane lipoprotein-sorting protein